MFIFLKEKKYRTKRTFLCALAKFHKKDRRSDRNVTLLTSFLVRDKLAVVMGKIDIVMYSGNVTLQSVLFC